MTHEEVFLLSFRAPRSLRVISRSPVNSSRLSSGYGHRICQAPWTAHESETGFLDPLPCLGNVCTHCPRGQRDTYSTVSWWSHSCECPACGPEALPRLVGQADNLRAQRHIVQVGSEGEGANEPGQKAFLTREADGAPSRTGAGLNGRS